jgi:organic radical activating enzyme
VYIQDVAAYLVKELFGPTLQGEGAHAGRPCVFLRFAVCNLACSWCDTDFTPEGATRLQAAEIVARLVALDVNRSRCAIVTGGEPALQWDAELAGALRSAGFRVHMETNGTRALAAPVDWLTVSPKPQFHEGRFALVLAGGDECKLVVDDTVADDALRRYEAMDFTELFLQPCMDADYERHLRRSVDLALRHPRWRLSLQLHKIVGLP